MTQSDFAWAGLILLGIALVIALIEFLLRLRMATHGYFVWAPGRRIKFLHDKAILPGADAVAAIEINSDGERGGPLPNDWDGVYRALFMGASVVECIALDQKSTWPEVVRRELEGHLPKIGARHIHVGNIGKSLLPTGAQVRILQAVRERYDHLDLIVLMVGMSDVIAWLEEGAPVARGSMPMDDRRIFEQSPANLSWHWRRLAITKTLLFIYHQYFGSFQLRDTYTKRIARRRERRQYSTLIEADRIHPTAMLNQFEQDLVKLLTLARAIAKRVILVRHPWLDENSSSAVEGSMWIGSVGGSVDSKEPGAYITTKAKIDLLNRIDSVCVRISEQEGVEQLEVKSLIPNTLEYYVDRVHLGVKGAEVVGRALAQKILKVSQESAAAG